MKLQYTELHAVTTAYPGVVKFDLRPLPPGVHALVGPNGGGKSTLLGAPFAGLYRELPGIDEGLVNFATARDAYIVNEFVDDAGAVLRTRVSIDGHTRDMKAVMEAVDPSGLSSVLGDGKVSTFDQIVEARFPTRELMLMGPFSCQSKEGGFLSRGPAKRKELWAEMIGLAHLEAKAQTAHEAASEWERARVRVVERRTALQFDAGDEVRASLEQRANALQTESARAELKRTELQDQIEGLEAERAAIADQAEQHATAVERQRSLTEAIGAKRAELEQIDRDVRLAKELAQDDLQRATSAYEAACRTCDNAGEAARKTHAELVADLNTRIAGNQQLNDRADEVRAAVTAKAEAQTQLEQLRDKEQRHADALNAAKEQVRQREHALIAVDEAARSLAAAEVSVRTLTVVKFGDQCGGDEPCKFVSKAVEDQKRIPDLQAIVQQGDAQREALKVWRDTVARETEAQRAAKISIAQVEARLRQLDQLAKYEPELAATQARIEGYQQQIQQAGETLAAREAELDAQHLHAERVRADAAEAAAERLKTGLANFADRREQIDASLAETESQLAAVVASLPQTAAAAQRLSVITQVELPALQRDWTANESILAAVAERRAALDRDRQRFDAARAQLATVEQMLATVSDELRAWQLNAKALGKDGVQTFEIEQAAPAVTAAANDLLLAAGLSRFTIELVTQVAKADGKGLKETFELVVWDNQASGGERKMGSLSGGQKALVDEALRLGIVIYHNTRNERPFRTAWRDETAGALDAETAPCYIAMLRRLQELGGFEHVLFVVHNLEVAALADSQVIVANGGIEIVKKSESELRKWLATAMADRRAA